LSLETDPPCSITWRIDADGNRVPGSLVTPMYKMARDLKPELPPPEEFDLVDRPPGSE
jgi:hypothetical protein